MSYQVGAILEFRGEYAFLSNHYVAPMVWRGEDFNSAEQAFAYAKTFFSKSTEQGERYRKEISAAKTPGEAKRIGRRAVIDVHEWDKRRVMYMREIVHAKFMTNAGLVGPLINTGARMLIEGNDWNDKFWGRVKEEGRWVGLNTLGVILMEERGWWSRGNEGRP